MRLRFGIGAEGRLAQGPRFCRLPETGVLVGDESRRKERNGRSMEVVKGCVGVIGVLATVYLLYVLLRGGDDR